MTGDRENIRTGKRDRSQGVSYSNQRRRCCLVRSRLQSGARQPALSLIMRPRVLEGAKYKSLIQLRCRACEEQISLKVSGRKWSPLDASIGQENTEKMKPTRERRGGGEAAGRKSYIQLRGGWVELYTGEQRSNSNKETLFQINLT